MVSHLKGTQGWTRNAGGGDGVSGGPPESDPVLVLIHSFIFGLPVAT